MDVTQRAFVSGEVAPALYARTDAERYTTALRTCRNAIVAPGGSVSKRPGTEFIMRLLGGPLTLTITPTSMLLLYSTTAVVTAVVHDADGNVVTGLTVTWESDDPTIASVASATTLTGTVDGVNPLGGVTNVRAHIAALGLVSNDCTVTVYDEYILHTFTTGSGAFVVTAAPEGSTVRALIVAGGGSGGSVDGTGVGGGGAGGGGVLDLKDADEVPVSVGSYPVSIGGGGPQQHADHTVGGGVFGVITGANGSDSTFAGHRAYGGGGGGGSDATIQRQGRAGGSGGGGASADDFMPAPGAYNGGLHVAGQGDTGFSGSHSGDVQGGIGGSWPGGSSDITGTNLPYGVGGIARFGPGNFGTPAGSGNGGEGGGQALGADGGHGADGSVRIRYLASSGIVATGGTITTISA